MPIEEEENTVPFTVYLPEEAVQDIQECAEELECTPEEFAFSLMAMGREQFEDMISGVSYIRVQSGEGGDIDEPQTSNRLS